jgi:hypothetical protein
VNLAEVNRLLAYVSAVDGRRVDDTTVIAWQSILGELELDDCLEAVRGHFARSTDWLMPANVRTMVGLIHERRRPHHDVLSLPSRFEEDPERNARIKRGIAECARSLSIARAMRPKPISDKPEPPLSASDEIRLRAIARAKAERRGAA